MPENTDRRLLRAEAAAIRSKYVALRDKTDDESRGARERLRARYSEIEHLLKRLSRGVEDSQGASGVSESAIGRNATLEAEWRPGDDILDIYRVMEILGEGGMGRVYRVYHRGWNVDLAVKCPLPGMFERETQKANFIRECETWVNLAHHPNVVSCHYVRMIGDIPRVFAEYVDGGTLEDWISSGKLYEEGKSRALERVLDIAIQFAWALQHAHEQGLIHQDVKSPNVMLTRGGVAKVTDFGLANARALAAEGAPSARPGSILASFGGMTPAYCSPEQADNAARHQAGLSHEQSAKLTRHTDIYSWAVSVFEMFNGGVGWAAGNVAKAALHQYLRDGAPRDDLPRMPEKVASLLVACLATAPHDRPRDFSQVTDVLISAFRESAGTDYHRQMPRAIDALSDNLNNRAVSLVDLSKQDDAEALWEKALHLDPHHLVSTYNLGLVRWRAGKIRPDVLLLGIREAATSAAEAWYAALLMGRVLLECGDCVSAAELLAEYGTSNDLHPELRSLSTTVSSMLPVSRRLIRDFAEETCPTQQRLLLSLEPDRLYYRTLDALSLSGDARYVLTRGKPADHQMEVRLWDAATGNRMHVFPRRQGATPEFVSEDGSLIVENVWATTARVCEAVSGRCICAFNWKKHDEPAEVLMGRYSLALIRSQTENAFGLYKCAREFSRVLHGFRCPHRREVTHLSLSDDGRYAVSGDPNGHIVLWEVACGVEFPSAPLELAGVRSVEEASATASEFQRLISGAKHHLQAGESSHAVRLARQARAMQGYQRNREALSIWRRLYNVFPKQRLAAVWQDCEFTVPLQDGPASVREHVAGVYAHAWPRIWEETSGERIDFSRCVPFNLSPSGRYAVLTYDPPSLWDLDEVRCLRTLGRDRYERSCRVSLSADARLALISHEKNLELWHLPDGKCLRSLDRYHTEGLLSPDGRYAFLGGWKSPLAIWDLAEGMPLFEVADDSEDMYRARVHNPLCLSSDGRFMLSALENQIEIWDVTTARRVRVLEGHQGGVTSASLSVDGRYAVSGGHDTSVKVWDLAKGKCLRTLEGHRGSPQVCLSLDAKYLLSHSVEHQLSRSRLIKIWSLDWELEERAFADWDEGARCHLLTFLSVHTPFVGGLPCDREPNEEEIKHRLMRRGKPHWNANDFRRLLYTLRCAGFGWLRPEGVRRELEKLADDWTEPPQCYCG